jgi:hypothetical protein
MFPILLAELRPLFFRYGLRRDKDESVEFEFNFLTPHPGFAFRWQHAIHQRLQIYNVPNSFEIGIFPGFRLRLRSLDRFRRFDVLLPSLGKRRAAIFNLPLASNVPILGNRP